MKWKWILWILTVIGFDTYCQNVVKDIVNKKNTIDSEDSIHIKKIIYYNNSQIKSAEIFYTNNTKDGHAIFYYKSGKVKHQGDYCKNLKCGTWYFFKRKNYQNVPDIIREYENGKLISKRRNYNFPPTFE